MLENASIDYLPYYTLMELMLRLLFARVVAEKN
jgi:hypothetical protein